MIRVLMCELHLQVCREMLAARRSAREALSDMAQQNARLVSAYVQKKQELRSVQETARASALQWEVGLVRLHFNHRTPAKLHALKIELT